MKQSKDNLEGLINYLQRKKSLNVGEIHACYVERLHTLNTLIESNKQMESDLKDINTIMINCGQHSNEIYDVCRISNKYKDK